MEEPKGTSRIPAIYIPVRLRNFTPDENGIVGVGFDIIGSTEVVRLRVSLEELSRIHSITKHYYFHDETCSIADYNLADKNSN